MMKQLKPNTKVLLCNGDYAIVKSLIGEGGQGSVYKCEVAGKSYALKVYNQRPKDAFWKNLKQNTEKGAPTNHFLWMLWTTKQPSIYGYVMKLRPSGYVDFTQFLLAKARFASWSAMLHAALQITCAFRELHRKGLSYQDLNDGNFFFRPDTGDVLICDNDNVCPADVNLGILGKCRYMAPEVVLGKSKPNNLSDYFSLSVVLFMLLMNNHPLDGKRVTSVPCLNDEIERNIYGEHPLFIYDEKDTSNRPVPGVHANVLRRWPLFPQFVRDAFTNAFSKEVMSNPNKRISDNEWIKILVQLRNQTITCVCGRETFIDIDAEHSTCFNCNTSIPRPIALTMGKQKIVLFPEMKLYASQTEGADDLFSVTGKVVRNSQNPNLWGIVNLSKNNWFGVLPNGKSIDIPQGKGFPIYKHCTINFGTLEGVFE